MKESIAYTYLAGLKEKLEAQDMKFELNALTRTAGASADDIARLRSVYPQCPDSLIDLLQQVDGTYYREYSGYKVTCYFLGSDVFEYPYYLLSAAQIVESATKHQLSIRDIYGDEMDEWLPVTRDQQPGHGSRDDRIDPDIPMGKWLHFSDCMNNGGTSQLFIDFNPCGNGTVGQIIRFLHDPDSYEVIADSFDTYLQNLIDDDYSFLQED
jgi:hypothetical protein